jgi:hypothetical protein
MLAKPRYFPRNLSVTYKPGYKVYEFLVVWQHESGSLERILDVFSRHNVKVLLTHSQVDEDTDEVVGTYYCDLTKADKPVETLRREIKGLGFVQSADYTSTEQTLFDKFLFPVTIWGRNRVLIMRLDPLLNIEKRLAQELGTAGSAIMFREGEGYAAETLNQYRAVLGRATPEILMENVKDGLRATGWGIFEFKTTKDGYDVTVNDGPLLDGTTVPSRFLCGIIAGIVESVYVIKVKVVGSAVDPKSRRVSVRLSKMAAG